MHDSIDQAIEVSGPALDKGRAAADTAGVGVALGITERTSSGTLYNAHTAREGQIFVIGVTAFLRGSDVPRDLPGADEIYGGDDDFMSKGNTTIVAPGGEIVPLTRPDTTHVPTFCHSPSTRTETTMADFAPIGPCTHHRGATTATPCEPAASARRSSYVINPSRSSPRSSAEAR